MHKQKIALISPYPPSKGTLNEYAYHLVAQFREKEQIEEIVLITDQLPEGEQYEIPEGKVPVNLQDVWKFNSLSNLFKILKAVRTSKADVAFFNIHFLSFGDKKLAAGLGLLTPLFCRLMGVPSVVLLHNLTETVDLSSAGITNNRLLQSIFGLIGTLLTFILLQSNLLTVTISKYVNILEKKYGAKNVALVPHGTFETTETPDFRLPAGPRQIMAFGKFGTYKKVEEMIEAVELVRSRTDENIEIVIAGTDSPNRVGYLEEIKQQYAKVDQIRFTGYVAEEDVPTVFGDSAITVFPYTSTTGSSGVLHQAGSYGCACILPNIGDLKTLIEEEGYAGEFFQPGSVESLADAIQKLLENEDQILDLAQKNYAASAGLPMADIADWYLLHFENLMPAPAFQPVPALAY
ncbi:glycosyltransferase [Lewinella sp. W8]|uniref:glycosyltransferase n=1 Tax=Lewinella sp. W8 TaxID=2528208 RepID=UPI00106803F2|nr:glycosyltransferase [Lewinella sp. W8]MTB52177.1 glycosyltransferase [Lewinella sp. W8]